MQLTSKLLRTISLAILFGGSSAIVFAAIVLVNAARAKGVPVPEAAATNAPIFIHFSKVALGGAVALMFGEILDVLSSTKTKLVYARYVTSSICVTSAVIFALAIVPPLAAWLPVINIDPEAHKSFQELHQVSRAVFGVTIFSALLSLVLPLFEKTTPNTVPTPGYSQPRAGALR